MITLFDMATARFLADFWKKVDVKDNDSCWNWMGSTSSKSIPYGRCQLFGRGFYVHRVAYHLAHPSFDIFESKINILHSCDNRLCCNPNHLFEGTNTENARDKTRKGRSYWKLSKELDKQIQERYIPYKVTARQLAPEFNVSIPAIYKAIQRKNRPI